MNNFNWKLSDSNFTLLDRLKICKFFLTPSNFWTQNKYVKEYEEKMAKFIGCKYAVFTSSGSTANTILAAYLLDNKPKKYVVFPSTTWITSVSPFIREGFIPHFIDITLHDFSMNLDKLEEYLIKNSSGVACVFVTSLLGFFPDIDRLLDIQDKYNVRIMMDNCEANFSQYYYGKRFIGNISNAFTSTTSTYAGHNLSSVEGGFVFTNKLKEYEYFLMSRNHGMTRSLNDLYDKLKVDNKFLNPKVDPRFDFNILGNNYRNTDINAFLGLLDFERRFEYINKRIELYELFYHNLDKNKYILPLPSDFNNHPVPFSLPIITKSETKIRINKAKTICKKLSIESRPIISGFLGYHTCLKKYFSNGKFDMDYINSIHLHNNGFYVGLHVGVKEKDILTLTKELNRI